MAPPPPAQRLLEALEPLRQQLEPALGPLVAALDAGARPLVPLLHRLSDAASPHLRAASSAADEALAGLVPWQVALLAAAATWLAVATLQSAAAALERVRRQGGWAQWAFNRLRAAPLVRGLLEREKAKVAAKIAASVKTQGQPIIRLPRKGRPAAAVLELLRARERGDVRVSVGANPMSGVVYIADESVKAMLDQAYCLFSWSNPLHADIFPSVRQMEAEVVAMTAAMLRGGPGTGAPDACGAMTSGGTESILLAVKAARDHMAATRGITRPEMVVGASAHAAFWKASEYFNVKLVVVPVGKDFRVHGAAVRRRIGQNTVLVVASAPSFPHGVVDDVQGIAAAAAAAGVSCHVDACLGGFLLPFAERLGHRVPPFDFRVPGVTSISADTHKFGMAHKGTSVLLHRSPGLRRHQFTAITDWSGGLYISPSMAGSRSGALIATAWASLVHLGEDGLLAAADASMSAAAEFARLLARRVPELEVLGEPHASVVAFGSSRAARRLNVYALNDLMAARGWHLNALQRPPALHFCFTAQHPRVATALVGDLAAAVAALRAAPEGLGAAGSAPLYGLAGVSPDRRLVGEFLVLFQDAMLAPP